jgi:glycosyltransferase involved in cell wall biosynthesis
LQNEPVIKRDSWPDQSTDHPKITLAMMVRNEEAHLGRCLEAMKGHVDDIVIVDTGSTDKTVEIAKSYGAKVYHHPWEDSFSIGRNHVISHVETEWLLQLDADEVMPPEDAKQVRDVMKSAHKSDTNLIHMVLINKAEDGHEEMSIINTGKIMRVTPALYFKNRVHNKLVCPGHTRLTNLKIIHYGYNLEDEELMSKKKERTTRLLLMQAEEQPEDPDTFYYLTIQYLRYEDWDLAIKYGKKAVSLYKEFEPKSQLQLLAMHSIAVSYYHKASARDIPKETQKLMFDECIRNSEMALELYPDYLDSNALLSSVYFALKDYDKCWKYSEKYLQVCDMLKKDKSKATVIPLNTLKNEWMICLQLAINFFEQADSAKAIAFVAKAEDLLPEDQKYRPSWGVFKYMITMGDPISLKNAEAIYKTGFRPE